MNEWYNKNDSEKCKIYPLGTGWSQSKYLILHKPIKLCSSQPIREQNTYVWPLP